MACRRIDGCEGGLLAVRGILFGYNTQCLLISLSRRGNDAVEHASVNEQQIAEALQRVPRNRWCEVLDFIASLQAPGNGEIGTPLVTKAAPEKQWTAAELRKLPVEQCDAILAEQAALLEEAYRNNRELTSFEAAQIGT
jgi:hypothetical protein